MTNTFAEIERTKAALVREKNQRVTDHQAWLKQCDEKLSTLAQRTVLLTEGIDLARLDRGRRVIEVRGDATQSVHGSDSDQRRDNVRAKAVSDAMRLLAENPQKLQEQYIGVKNYAHFGDQREDHEYCYGPRHGTIVFSVGLTRDARKDELTADEIEDALYVLHVLPALSKSKAQAA